MNNSKKIRTVRGAQAREKIKRAAMEVLERVGYHQLRVTDVTDEAGVAAGLFYHYFDDLNSLIIEVLTDFLRRFESAQEVKTIRAGEDIYELYLAHFKVAVENYCSHPGLMRSLMQLSDEVPEIYELRHQSNLHQMRWLSKGLSKMFPESELTDEESLILVCSLAGMSETILREYYITRDSTLRECQFTNDEMAEFLTVMFYRGLLLKSPVRTELNFSKKLTRVNEQGLLPKLQSTRQ